MLKKMVLALFVWCLLICQPLQASAMSLNVQDGEVDELLRSVARMAGLNLILDESVKGKVSLKLEDWLSLSRGIPGLWQLQII